jgi:pilus assembly protein CpaB
MDQNAKNADGTPNLARTATLEVDPLDAQKLALAQRAGSLSLVLRKAGEEQNNPVVETVSLEDLRYSIYGGARYAGANPVGAQIPRSQVSVAPPTPPRRVVRRASAPARPKPVTNNVEIVRGTVGQDYKLGGTSGS